MSNYVKILILIIYLIQWYCVNCKYSKYSNVLEFHNNIYSCKSDGIRTDFHNSIDVYFTEAGNEFTLG